VSVAKVVEISATSTESFDDAVKQGIAKASETLRNIRSAWVKEQRASVQDGKVVEFQVNLQVTFVLE
jgi:flavin-binding protein dodecin